MTTKTPVVLQLLLEDERFTAALNDARSRAKDLSKELKKSKEPADGLGASLGDLKDPILSGIAGLGKMAVAAGAAAAAFGLVSAGFVLKAGIAEAIEAENEINNLSFALARTGEFSQAAVDDIKGFADAIRTATGVSDGMVIQLVTLAKNYSLTNAEAKLAANAAVELSAATGKDLKTSLDLVAKSFSGNAGKLAVLNPAIRDLTKSQLEAGGAARLLLDQFGGTAASKLQTFSGAVGATTEHMNDFLEQVGNLVVKNPAAVEAINIVGEQFQILAGFVEDNGETFRAYISKAIKAFLAEMPDVIRSVGVMAEAFGVISGLNPFDELATSVTDTRDELDEAASAAVLLADGILQVAQGYFSLRKLVGENSALVTLFAPEEIAESEAAIRRIEELRQSLADRTTNIATPGGGGTTTAAELAGEAPGVFDQMAAALERRVAELLQTPDGAATSTPKPQNQASGGGSGGGSPVNSKNLVKLDPEKFGIRDAVLPGLLDSMDEFGAYSAAKFDGVIEEYARRFEEAAKSIAGSFAANLLGGKEGARKFLAATSGAIADVIAPGAGAAVAPIVEALSQGPEHVKAMINEFVDALPELIENIADSIPVVIQALADRAGEIATALARAMPLVAIALADPKLWIGVAQSLANQVVEALRGKLAKLDAGFSNFSSGFADATGKLDAAIKNIPELLGAEIPRRVGDGLTKLFTQAKGITNPLLANMGNAFANAGKQVGSAAADTIKSALKAFIQEIKDFLPDWGGGGGGDGGFVSGTGTPLDRLATGAIVRGRGNRDSVPALLSPGELVIDRTTGPRLNRFIDQQTAPSRRPEGSDLNSALLTQLIQLLSQPMQVQTAVQLDSDAFANINLQLSRRNARTAA